MAAVRVYITVAAEDTGDLMSAAQATQTLRDLFLMTSLPGVQVVGAHSVMAGAGRVQGEEIAMNVDPAIMAQGLAGMKQ